MFKLTKETKIVAAFRGMHASPVKHSFGKCDRRMDRQTDGWKDRRRTKGSLLVIDYWDIRMKTNLNAHYKTIKFITSLIDFNFVSFIINFSEQLSPQTIRT